MGHKEAEFEQPSVAKILSGHLRRPGFFPTREQRPEKIAASETVSFVHLFCSAYSAVFLCTFSASVVIRNPGKLVRFSRHDLVSWHIRASSTRGGHSRQVKDLDLSER